MHVEEIWESRNLRAVAIRTALAPLSFLYAAGWLAYLGWYKLGFKRSKTPHPRTLCIGNLVVGGVGKTPVTIFVAQGLIERGEAVVISSSGYGGPNSVGAHLAPRGPLLASEWGDEPALLRELVPQADIIVGRDRLAASEIAAEHFEEAILVMDDGFQHLPVGKKMSIVLDPPRRNRWCLPAGPYREPRWLRSRADLVLPGEYTVVPEPLELDKFDGDYVLLSGIGQPGRFRESVRSVGLSGQMVQEVQLPDHADLSVGNLLDGVPKNLPIVTTRKDWVKLRERADLHERRWMVANYRVRVSPEARFIDMILERLSA